jgi:hypothetical protein
MLAVTVRDASEAQRRSYKNAQNAIRPVQTRAPAAALAQGSRASAQHATTRAHRYR